MKLVRTTAIFDYSIYYEAGAKLPRPTQKVIACAVITNPYANTGVADQDQLNHLAEISLEVGTDLVKRSLPLFSPAQKPTAYGKAAIVGIAGQREHGAAVIHLKVGLAMRRGLGAGPALIPGNEKQGGPGTSVDLIFGDTGTGWEYDMMDSIEVSVPGSPKPDEIVLIVGFATGGRPNARIKGVTAEQVAALMSSFTDDNQ